MKFKLKLTSVIISAVCAFSAISVIPASAADGSDSFEEAIVPVMGTTYVMNTESGDYDHFKFELSESGTIECHVESLLDCVNFKVYRADNPGSPHGGDLWNFDDGIDKKIKESLNVGTYYIAFGCPENFEQQPGEYSVKFSFESANETFPETTDGTNNDFTSANKVTVGDTIRGFTAIYDAYDFYLLELDEPSRVCWNIKSNNQNLRIIFYDSQFNEIHTESFYWENGVIDDAVSVRLPAGVSYFNVASPYAAYEFTTSIVPYYDIGDVNMDTNINLYDVIEVAKYILNMTSFDNEQLSLGDMDENGVVNLYDAIEIAEIIMG